MQPMPTWTIEAVSDQPDPNLTMIQTLASVCSYVEPRGVIEVLVVRRAVRVLRRSASCVRHQWPPLLCERFAQVGIADGEERALPELREEHPEPQPADRQRRRQVEPVHEEVAHVLAPASRCRLPPVGANSGDTIMKRST